MIFQGDAAVNRLHHTGQLRSHKACIYGLQVKLTQELPIKEASGDSLPELTPGFIPGISYSSWRFLLVFIYITARPGYEKSAR